ncbi:hypothetical protein [Phocaeicola faecicola]|uniref:hypothetical protein n=1 Tax=Phocaeicola faecicola TaxID=2739389 RepID=UPI002A82ABF8|nr:hypothetical protein [Phocaeicola faecicola]MDD6908959.1 hypothetical protein [Bacteroidaceae bacterium]MDY4872529.1 hypothetical protein [Phocaeicola faecicola]
MRTGKEAGGSSGTRPAADDLCVTAVPEGAGRLKKEAAFKSGYFHFVKSELSTLT